MYLASSRFPGSLILKKKEYGKCFVFRYRKINSTSVVEPDADLFGLELIYFIVAGNTVISDPARDLAPDQQLLCIMNDNVSLYELTLHYKIIMSNYLIFYEFILNFKKVFQLVQELSEPKKKV
jgi:hypothetical protein